MMDAATKEIVVEAKNLVIGYDDYVVIDKINFSVRQGEVFVILGGSGCGKSTLLKHLIGLYKPLAGDIHIEGASIVHADEQAKDELSRRFGVLYQSGALFSSLNLQENIELTLREFTRLSKEMIAAVAKHKLSLVGLEGFEHFLPAEISGGMKKRAGLARALALSPKILFFDEPSAGLDPISSAELDVLILELRKHLGCTIIMVTHELDSIFAVADRVIVLDKNTKGIVAEGDPRQLRDHSPNEWVRRFLNRANMK